MSTTSESSSEHGEPEHGKKARLRFGADPNSRAYAPEMDNLKKSGLYPMRREPGWGDKLFLYYQGFSFEGPSKINLSKFIFTYGDNKSTPVLCVDFF